MSASLGAVVHTSDGDDGGRGSRSTPISSGGAFIPLFFLPVFVPSFEAVSGEGSLTTTALQYEASSARHHLVPAG